MFIPCCFTTSICVQVHFILHYNLSEIGQIYCGESAQPLNKQGLIAMNRLIHYYLIESTNS
jgi:hypothetical protein